MPNRQTGNSGMKYIDRGDPVDYDFTVGDFTKDEAWHTLDLSSIIPAGSRLVHFYCGIANSYAERTIHIMKNGNSNSRNIVRCRSQVAAKAIAFDCWVLCDDNGLIQYMTTSGGWTAINFAVRGWLI